MPLLKFRDKDLFYSVSGAGPALVFVHGFGEDSRVWDEFTAPFKKDHQVVSLDLPGAGQSPAIPGITIEGMAEAVRAVVEELRISQLVLTGHSMGGYVCLAYAEKWPDSLRALCMFHSQPYADSEEKKIGRLKSREFVGMHGAAPYVSQLVPGLFAPAFARERPEVVQRLIGWASAYPAEGIIAALDAMRLRPDRSDVLRNAAWPVLFFIGLEDGAIPADASKKQTTLPPVASIHYLEGVGHMGMLEAREEVQGIFGRFLEEGGE